MRVSRQSRRRSRRLTRVMDRSKRGSDADDVGGVEARGSGEGMCLRRSMYDQHARRAALDSSLDDDQHELLTSVRIIVHNRTRLSTLKMNSSSRSSSSRLARAHERAGRGRAGRASKPAGTEDTPCALSSCVGARSPVVLRCHVNCQFLPATHFHFRQRL